MQQDPAPAGSPGSQRDAGPTRTPTMASPELRSEGAPRSPSPAEQAEEEDFQFLQCQGCHTQAKCPKLLPCLHTLCSGCLEAPGLHCPICQGPRALDGAPVLDNIFFESLQRRLAVHQQVVDMQAACTRCKEPADFWCFECEQLLCSRCFEAHQWFLKHEARPLAELRSQSVLEFLESTRKSNNIFCSNPNHRSPMLTSIYCRGCHKPLCCSCALLDSGHSDLKCDLSAEVLQRQDELDATARALRERGGAFGAALAQVRAAIGQLGRARADAEDLIRERVRQVVAHVQAQERELLQQVHACYQRDYEELAARLSRLEAVLQRMRTGGALVRRMKHYASDQEVLDMHGFLHEALCRLRQEEPQGPQAAVRAEGFDEFKVRLQDLVARVTQATDAILSRRTSPQSASTPGDLLHVDLEDSGTLVGRKRKSCYTQCPQKMIKLESEEKERPAQSSPEQPRPSTSKAVSPPQLDGTPSPGSPNVGEEVDPANSNHVAGDDPEEAEERVVVISSSEDSDDTEIAPRQELDTSSSESSDLQLEGLSSPRAPDVNLADPHAEDRPLVFFDLKIDSETQKISQLAAVNRETKFRVLIQPGAFSVCSKAVSLEAGLQHFLGFLGAMRRPVLACYSLWGPSLSVFLRALEDMNKLGAFQEAVSGFLALLPLVRELVPGASSFKLKSLAETYLARSMSEGSALAAVLAMRDLCLLLEVSPGRQLARHVHSFHSMQCFSSLQPLVQAAILSRAEARLLALHKASFQELLSAHRGDPQQGLEKYCRSLGLRATAPAPALPTPRLQALSAYFQRLSEGTSASVDGHSLEQGAAQQS
uniref:Protein PML n=1 Tax=Oryctolagus cuniculus TaxID=9986 RepID=A0A5F9CZ42_RABIT